MWKPELPNPQKKPQYNQQQNQTNPLGQQTPEQGAAQREGARPRQDVNTTWDSSGSEGARAQHQYEAVPSERGTHTYNSLTNRRPQSDVGYSTSQTQLLQEVARTIGRQEPNRQPPVESNGLRGQERPSGPAEHTGPQYQDLAGRAKTLIRGPHETGQSFQQEPERQNLIQDVYNRSAYTGHAVPLN